MKKFHTNIPLPHDGNVGLHLKRGVGVRDWRPHRSGWVGARHSVGTACRTGGGEEWASGNVVERGTVSVPWL